MIINQRNPKVTGVLPVALERACKLSEFFMRRDKTYVGIMKTHKEIKLEILQKIIDKEFIGKIKQLPPKRSKVKRQERVREIKKFELLEKQGKEVLFLADVEAGTYIRKLIHDLGLRIGGAHMAELRRTKAGIFSEEDKEWPIINLYEFDKAIDEFKKGKEEKLRK
ncbi:MAG TPA: RNA-guided pseudouridylation complex pseudouridine synthase subunit Cbf5, partial [Candidatus Paceibacterota bacterium]|nr:RNA-guided pseudouridylation complex pseudouridine synthase subunit Cbf5 [Candidatus Paceibacterota bacterium]